MKTEDRENRRTEKFPHGSPLRRSKSLSQARIEELKSIPRISSVREIRNKFNGSSVIEPEASFRAKLSIMSTSDRILGNAMYQFSNNYSIKRDDTTEDQKLITISQCAARNQKQWTLSEKKSILKQWSKSAVCDGDNEKILTRRDAEHSLKTYGITPTSSGHKHWTQWQEAINDAVLTSHTGYRTESPSVSSIGRSSAFSYNDNNSISGEERSCCSSTVDCPMTINADTIFDDPAAFERSECTAHESDDDSSIHTAINSRESPTLCQSSVFDQSMDLTTPEKITWIDSERTNSIHNAPGIVEITSPDSPRSTEIMNAPLSPFTLEIQTCQPVPSDSVDETVVAAVIDAELGANGQLQETLPCPVANSYLSMKPLKDDDIRISSGSIAQSSTIPCASRSRRPSVRTLASYIVLVMAIVIAVITSQSFVERKLSADNAKPSLVSSPLLAPSSIVTEFNGAQAIPEAITHEKVTLHISLSVKRESAIVRALKSLSAKFKQSTKWAIDRAVGWLYQIRRQRQREYSTTPTP